MPPQGPVFNKWGEEKLPDYTQAEVMVMNRRAYESGKGSADMFVPPQPSKGQQSKGRGKGDPSFRYQQPDQSRGYGHWSSEEGYSTHSFPVAQGRSGQMNHQQNGWGGKGSMPDQQSWQAPQPVMSPIERQMAALASAMVVMAEDVKEMKQSRSRSATPVRTPRRRVSPGSPAEMMPDFPMEDQARVEDGRYPASRALSSREDMRYQQWTNSSQYYPGAEYNGGRSPNFGR